MPPNRLVERVSFRDSDHTYHLAGKKIPSVTTLLANLSKPGLVYWSANMGAAAAADHIRLVGEQGNRINTIDGFWQLADEVHDIAKRAHTIRKNTAAAKGNIVHAAIEQYHADFFNATPPDRQDAPEAYAAWTAFIEWWKGAGLTLVSSERKIVDPDQRYAGRLDLLCEDGDERLFVCDVKTSGGIYPEHVLQNAAYAAAVEDELEREVSGTRVLWLPEGAEKLIVVERDEMEWRRDFEIFESLITLHAHRKGLDDWLKEVRDEHGPKKEGATT